jgi:hypothetical protein
MIQIVMDHFIISIKMRKTASTNAFQFDVQTG